MQTIIIYSDVLKDYAEEMIGIGNKLFGSFDTKSF